MYKVVIADDEPLIRAGLRKLIHWDELGMEIVCEACDGLEAYSYICKKSVDILITDIRMEKMDGLELIEKAKLSCPSLHCIVLSGFDDFIYTKRAIKLGIDNYILKPIDENELLETLRGIEETLSKKRQDELVSEADKQVIMQTVLRRWLTGNIEESALRQRADMLDIPLKVKSVQACVLRILDQCSLQQRKRVALAFVKQWGTIKDIDLRICWDVNGEIAIIFLGEIEKCKKLLKAQLEQMIQHPRWANNMKLFAAFGTLQQNAIELHDSYNTAKIAAELSFILPAGCVTEFNIECIPEDTSEIPKINIGLLEDAIHINDEAAILMLWEQWEDQIVQQYLEPDLLKRYATEVMCRLIVQRKNEFKGEFSDWNEREILEQLFADHSVGQLTETLKHFSVEYSRQIYIKSRKMNPAVRRVLSEIEKHYDQELTLRRFAEQFRVNPVYLGRLFKDETGQLFTSYLNDVRIREAKRMLKETSQSIAAISVAVGYQSQGYFTSQFKKSTGLYPREYRMRLDE